MKTQLTPMDISYLEAARGLSLTRGDRGRQFFDARGLKPSVEDYNKAVKMGIYGGSPITPIGS